ncbi:MAG: hypothetical protein A2Y10_10700 [Planctomycetes bacterium GWF2_41_51]|nr:MAG: hypothetical protein A2Y10_10700 [Planctomycetes bacterium GWF2_41_51]HBG28486.1 alkaline phosphatase [Phycisphaerales bacterium]
MKAIKYSTLMVILITSFAAAATSQNPKNIIMIIVDGGGRNHIQAANYYSSGKKSAQKFEKFPVQLSVTTFPYGSSYDSKKAVKDFGYVKDGYTDSAAASTALATGIKTNRGSIGVDHKDKKIENVIEKCEKLGMATGVVTTVPYYHATPAGFSVHDDSRNDYVEIAEKMINESALEVIFGCGNPLYDNNGNKLSSPEKKWMQMWSPLAADAAGADADDDGTPDKWTLIQSKQEFVSLMEGPTPKRVCGVPETAETLQQKRSGKSRVPFDVPLNENVPNLSEMSLAALNVLDDDPDGFFVMIEAGAVDWASHGNERTRMIEEMMDFYSAADAVINWVETKSNWNDTLLIITADHQTGYLTGPKKKAVVNNGKGKMPSFEWHSGGHTNAPVFLYAKGQGSKNLTTHIKGKDPVYGNYIDNTDIPKTIFSILEARKTVSK